MRIVSLAAAATLGIAASLMPSVRAAAAEITVLSSNGVTAVMAELGPAFERATGHKLVIHYDVASVLKTEIEGGRAFDVAILTGPVTDALIQAGKIAAAGRADIARSGIGVAMRRGAAKPDISTTEAFKRTLLAAKSVAYTTAGASGIYFASLLERLGIAEAVKPKAKLLKGGRVAELVASGEAELSVQQISEILPVAGVELVGPLPPELQLITVFSAGVGRSAKEPQAARALVEFLAAPAAASVYKSKGMKPG